MAKKLRTRKHKVVLARSRTGDAGITVILVILGAFMFLPMYYCVIQAFKPLDELWMFPPRFYVMNPTFQNFKDLFTLMNTSMVPFSRYIFNTVFTSVAGTTGNLFFSSLAAYAKVNEFGFIESPYRKVEKEYDENGEVVNVKVTDVVEYLTADEEDNYIVAQANEPLIDNKYFVNDRVSCRHREDITEDVKEKMDYMDVSPKHLISVATALIPFLENDDTNRALMGSNMQRQAVPLLKTESAIVATGIESSIAQYSGVIVTAKEAGVVVGCASNCIKIREDDGNITEYPLKKFERSNAGTCLNQRPIVSTGDRVAKGEIIADGPSTNNGELALGKNILIGYMEWEGYNYEDAILLSEKLVQDDVFTSIHIEKHEIEARDTKLGPEEITRDIPNVGDDALKDLDEDGIIRVGAEVHSGDILVGKVSRKRS